jgi:hypothetical protein
MAPPSKKKPPGREPAIAPEKEKVSITLDKPLVDEMEEEAGPASPEAYERVLAQWFAED